MKQKYHHFTILLGEDDLADARITKMALDKIGFDGSFEHLMLGTDVINRLNDTENKSRVSLLLLDISLPGVSGKDILKRLRESETHFALPILILSGSSSIRDYKDCMRLGANAYIKKTSDMPYFNSVIKHFVEVWAELTTQEFY